MHRSRQRDTTANILLATPVYLSFHNEDFSTTSANIVDGRLDTFALTTGGFPQDIVLSIGQTAAANISRVYLTMHDVKDIVLEKCNSLVPNTFERIAERTLKRSKDDVRQEEQLDFDLSGAGKGVKFLRLRILSGYNQFVGIFRVEVEGEESQQRIAVIESSPDVLL